MTVSGSMTLETAAVLLANGVNALEKGASQFDLSGVANIDSSGLAVLFGWQRAAHAQGLTLQIVNPPHNLISLAEMYGVSELLPLS
ncbi:MAG: STAS domain-containing protein [Rhodocyclaceae bacterium]|nr:STAS domain-containing protein [Rhodocyclaceae bacterium]